MIHYIENYREIMHLNKEVGELKNLVKGLSTNVS